MSSPEPYGWAYQTNLLATHSDSGFTRIRDMAELLMRNEAYNVIPLYDHAKVVQAESGSTADRELLQQAVDALIDASKGTFVDKGVVLRICCGTPELTRPHAESCKVWNALGALRVAPLVPSAEDKAVYETVKMIRKAAGAGVLSLLQLADENTPVDPEFAVAALRSSFPWRDIVPGWFEYRDHVVRNWPDESTKARELAGLQGVQESVAEPVTTASYVQPVPDHCDRITWRGHYLRLPLAAPTASQITWDTLARAGRVDKLPFRVPGTMSEEKVECVILTRKDVAGLSKTAKPEAQEPAKRDPELIVKEPSYSASPNPLSSTYYKDKPSDASTSQEP